MSATRTGSAPVRREAWGSLRKLPSGRWQARYPAPDGETYTARTEDDKPLTFLTKTDARTWLAAMHTKISRQDWEPPSTIAARRRAQAAAEMARSIGFAEYADRWITMMRCEPKKNGKQRALDTIRSYKGKVDGYLVPEFGDLPIREIDAARIRVLIQRLDGIPSPLNPRSKFNGVTRPVLTVLMMILRQAARDGIIPAIPAVSVPRQKIVIKDVDAGADEDVATPAQVEALYDATPQQWAIMVLLAAWCQLRRAECLGVQRRDIQWLDDGGAILHVRRRLSANTGDYSSELKSEAGRRSLAIPRLMLDRLKTHLHEQVAQEAFAPLVPTNIRGSVPLSNTRWGYIWMDSREAVSGLPARFRFHDLRHAGLTIFAQEGATLAELMRRGGRSDIRVVLRYQHATLARDRELADRMSDRIEAKMLVGTAVLDKPGVDGDGHL